MIKIINKSKTIEKYLKRLGQKVVMVRNGEETELYAVIEPAWRRNKSRFESSASEIGRCYDGYYFYYGPAGYDIRTLESGDYALIDGERYYLIRADIVKTGIAVQYFRGVLKKENGGEDYGFV